MKSPVLAALVAAAPLFALPALAATAPVTPKPAVAPKPVAAPKAAAAATSFDGNWSVLIVTDKGTCDKAYRYPVVIRSGAVLYGGRSGFAVDGRVDAKGVVRVRIAYGGQAADGVGRLALKSGSGTWTAGTACTGRWQAERRS
jgi:hypothetical protein